MNKINRLALVVTVVLLVGLGWGAWQVDAAAGAITVNTLEDELVSDGDCSLREAIEAANTNVVVDGCTAGEASAVDTITFAVEGTITVSEQLVITAGGALVIDGGNVITISGGDATRVIYVDIGSTLTLQRLRIADGYTEGEDGAGLYNNKANITIQECQFLHNRMGESSRGGGVFSHNGILTVMDSLFDRNGSGVSDTYCGGGDISGGEAEFIRTTFLHNEGGGDHYQYCEWGWGYVCYMRYEWGGGGLCNDGASVLIRESSFIANTGGEGGGGMLNRGETTILNSTFSGNTANGTVGYGGGILNPYTYDDIFTLTIKNSTFVENSAKSGGGIYMQQVTLITNSIIANQESGGDCEGSITDGGHNISSDDTCNFDTLNSSFPNTDPLLGLLQDNGGPTETYALLDGSPAIDAGSPEDCPTTDQRGIPRPVDGDLNGEATCDMGAYEYQPGDTVTTILSDNPDPSTIGYPFTVNFRVSSSLGTPTGEVTVTVNDKPATCSAMLVDGQGSCELTLDTLGVHLLTASYAGAEGFDACSDSEPHSVVLTSITTITSDDPDPSLVGEPFTVTVNVNSLLGIPPGKVSVTVSDNPTTCSITLVDGWGACQLMLDSIGDYLLTATYEGAEIYDPSSDSERHSVLGYPTEINITSDAPDPSFETQLFNVTFIVSSAFGIPTGEVYVTVNDNPATCSATLVNGLGSCELAIDTAGDYLLTATYTGSQEFYPSSDSELHTVTPIDTTITTITSDEPDPSEIGEAFTVIFTVSSWPEIPTGNVTVTVGDSSITCTAELVNGQGSCEMALDIFGFYTLTATYSGAEGFPPSSDSEPHRVGTISIQFIPLVMKY